MPGGRFIVFEGLDGSGTSTQAGILAQWLRHKGIDAELTREPTDGPVGRLIREVLADRVVMEPAALALLFAADRVDHLEQVRRHLGAERWVVSDRYVLSSLAYQAADGLDPGWVQTLNHHAPAPDLTVFVNTDPEVCMARIAARGGTRERFETLERQREVLSQYQAHLKTPRLTGTLISIAGNGSVDEVAHLIRDQVDAWIKAAG
jgi:dTMP kinase